MESAISLIDSSNILIDSFVLRDFRRSSIQVTYPEGDLEYNWNRIYSCT